MSLHCKLVPVQYREYKYGLLVYCDNWRRSDWPHAIILVFAWPFLHFIFSMLRNLTGGTVIIKYMQENGDGR